MIDDDHDDSVPGYERTPTSVRNRRLYAMSEDERTRRHGAPARAPVHAPPISDGAPIELDEDALLSQPVEAVIDDPRAAAIWQHLKNHARRVAARRRGDTEDYKGLDGRIAALEGAHRWVRTALIGVTITALGSLGAAVSKVWSSAEAVTVERVHLERALDDIKEMRDELRAIQRRGELIPDRADTPVATLRTP